jgi:hypothetical protein
MKKRPEPFNHADVVCLFDELGYRATFRQVADRLGVDPRVLTCNYPSREALGEIWLTSVLPNPPDDDPGLHGAFTGFMLPVLEELTKYRDFSRDWIMAIGQTMPMNLGELVRLHDSAGAYFYAWLMANADSISLPPGLVLEDVCSELSDGMCTLSFMVLMQWSTDRSLDYQETRNVVDALGYLLEALLMRRREFGEASVLVHLWRVGGMVHSRLLEPLLELVAKPDRVSRLLDPVSLIEFVRTLRSSPAARR